MKLVARAAFLISLEGTVSYTLGNRGGSHSSLLPLLGTILPSLAPLRLVCVWCGQSVVCDLGKMSLQRRGETGLSKGRFYSKLIPNKEMVGAYEVSTSHTTLRSFDGH